MVEPLAVGCVPRDSVFDPSVRDTVYSIDDLATIDHRSFFAENYITQGMRQLLTESFSRLEGKSQNAPGAYLLSQSMGGGKTHNLLALGLLALHPAYRQPVMGDFYQPSPMGRVRVATFSGRRNAPFGIWGEIAQQIKRREVFNHLYSPLQAPGDDDWINLLEGEPTLIMLDELPPYFNTAQAVEVGATTLDVITTAAIANLLVAVTSGKLSNVCVVLTDLRGSAYAMGSERLSGALQDLEQEANRSVQRIDPVRLNSDEFYSILKTRLFRELPLEAPIEEVADAYARAVDEAKRLDLTTASPQQLRVEILTAYPFHPGLRDLYARFRENQGFQQTRALIRIMRMVVAHLWNSGDADKRYLIGAHDLDLHDADLLNEIHQINRSLENAVAHDIAEENGGSVAEQIDAADSKDAQDAARLIFMSSLSTAVNPTIGLTRSEIVGYLAAPARDLSALTKALDRLQTDAWYLHATHDGRLLFKNVENLNAKLESYAKGISVEDRLRELRKRLETLFAPKVRDCYQTVAALPALDEVQLTDDRITLIVMRPQVGAQEEMRRFHDAQQFKNRVLFLTARAQEFQPVLDRMAYVRAIDAIIGEFQTQGTRESDPQLQDARETRTKQEANFFQAVREAFHTVWYPTRRELAEVELRPEYVANDYGGEQQIKTALVDVFKFRPDVESEGLRQAVETRLWLSGTKEMRWAEITSRAAQDPSWDWHHPRALDDLKQDLTRRDQWRDLGNGFLQRGPFPRPATSVSVQVLSRDPTTGKARLRITPRHATLARIEEDGPATTYSAVLDAWELETDEVKLSFIGEDSTGEHETGEPVSWTNTIDVKHRLFQDGSQRRCELKAIPAGEIRYTVDGASPTTSGQRYDEPFVVPDGTRFVLALAAKDGVQSVVERFEVPAGRGGGVVVNSKLPATWRRTFKHDATSETFTFLDQLARHRAVPAGFTLTGMKDQHYWEFGTDDGTAKDSAEVRKLADYLMGLFPGRNITLEVHALQFTRGQDLLDLVAEMKTSLRDGEVRQEA
ncbi:MAG: DUF499 domain-containing protein [Chloroflexia bacterium]|nr:DUF499 domain-containing protein [Chloroflexia bacterium]